MTAATPSLFNKKTIRKLVAIAPLPNPARQAALGEWAADIKSGKIAMLSEVALHGPFVQKVLIEGLGYTGPIGNQSYSVTQERAIIRGSVDVALGRFEHGDGEIIAPFELKGADTINLDAIMPGRAKTPVDQAWEYATNNVGTKWVLVSNYLEMRLYSYGEGRQAHEMFDLAKLHLPDEYARAQMLLSVESLLGGRTADLLADSKRENKDITDRLYADYKTLRGNLIGEVRRERPDMDPLAAIRTGQTILDRILFIAFAEDTGLLPTKILERAFETGNAFNPAPVWGNFLGLFRAINEGSPPLKVPRYNGGLFAHDAVIAGLSMPDQICEGFKRLSEYDFASEISVTVLGHIFEQSIADVEQLQAEARGDAPTKKKAGGTSGRRKRDGVVYTPDYIARFIVEQTLGTHCREIFDALLVDHAVKGATRADDPIKWKSAAAERAFWQTYRARISKLRIVDPACGSGVFLVMAFDWLKAELMRCNTALEKLGEGALYEPDSEILTHNLFGVDVNEESVEIAKLSLWIKTARHGKVLDSLDNNFRVGDSLIEDANFSYLKHGFVWKERFKEVFDEGGFDIVLGNPPYVRQELLKDLKPWLKKRFDVFHGAVDLYAYFFERGHRLLKPGGRLGYITSATFFKTGSGSKLRDYLREKVTIESAIDFGDFKVFEAVATYPTILTFRNQLPKGTSEFPFWIIGETAGDRFDNSFVEESIAYPQAALTAGSWELEPKALRALRRKIQSDKATILQEYGPPLYGIKTGRNEVFVIDRTTRDTLIAESPLAQEIIRPLKIGDDLERWHSEASDRYLICAYQGIQIDRYPSVQSYLESHRERLELKPIGWKPKAPDERWPGRKAGSYKWYELQDTVSYHLEFLGPKIIYPEFSQGRKFSFDRSGSYLNNKAFFFQGLDGFLLALLNSRAMWFVLRGLSAAQRGGEWRLELRRQYVETLPIPPATDAQKAELAALAEAAQAAAEARYSLQQDITRRISDLSPPGKPPKLTEKLKQWWSVPDFAAFRAEVKKAFKTDIPLSERTEWESWIARSRPEIHTLTADIARIEREIDAKVYALFDLTRDEIALLEANIQVARAQTELWQNLLSH